MFDKDTKSEQKTEWFGSEKKKDELIWINWALAVALDLRSKNFTHIILFLPEATFTLTAPIACTNIMSDSDSDYTYNLTFKFYDLGI